jgi:hypothetical protein
VWMFWVRGIKNAAQAAYCGCWAGAAQLPIFALSIPGLVLACTSITSTRPVQVRGRDAGLVHTRHQEQFCPARTQLASSSCEWRSLCLCIGLKSCRCAAALELLAPVVLCGALDNEVVAWVCIRAGPWTRTSALHSAK